jgi:hypothetical protein
VAAAEFEAFAAMLSSKLDQGTVGFHCVSQFHDGAAIRCDGVGWKQRYESREAHWFSEIAAKDAFWKSKIESEVQNLNQELTQAFQAAWAQWSEDVKMQSSARMDAVLKDRDDTVTMLHRQQQAQLRDVMNQWQ